FSVRPAGHELLLAYFGGAYARELEAQGGLEAAAREELVRLYGGALGRRIRRSTATAWAGDPWARGSYSAARPGCAGRRRILGPPVADRVSFRGEACTTATLRAAHAPW